MVYGLEFRYICFIFLKISAIVTEDGQLVDEGFRWNVACMLFRPFRNYVWYHNFHCS